MLIIRKINILIRQPIYNSKNINVSVRQTISIKRSVKTVPNIPFVIENHAWMITFLQKQLSIFILFLLPRDSHASMTNSEIIIIQLRFNAASFNHNHAMIKHPWVREWVWWIDERNDLTGIIIIIVLHPKYP